MERREKMNGGIVLLLFGLGLLAGCGAVVVFSSLGIAITPVHVTIVVGHTQAFTVFFSNSRNTAVAWEVNGIVGGNATVGTITVNGLFTAPAVVPFPPTVVVTAVANADPTQTSSATVTIVDAGAPAIAPPTDSVATIGAGAELVLVRRDPASDGFGRAGP